VKAQLQHWPLELEDEELYKRVFRALVALGASVDEAGDALQEAYERVLRKDEHIDRLDGWLFVVAQRRWRRARLRRRLFSRLGAASGRTVAPTEPALVLPEVRELPNRQRQVFVARHVLGLSNAETAQALGMAEGTVSATNHQALRALRQRLGGDV
jgi:DNA-directed RNA polymerase specialized sigma24 family protein